MSIEVVDHQGFIGIYDEDDTENEIMLTYEQMYIVMKKVYSILNNKNIPLMRGTGIYDRNNEEIIEGNIIECGDSWKNKGIVKWDSQNARFIIEIKYNVTAENNIDSIEETEIKELGGIDKYFLNIIKEK